MHSVFALAQTASDSEPEKNLAKARILMERTAGQADLVIFPEMFMSFFPSPVPPAVRCAAAQTLDGPFVSSMRALARRFRTWLIFGMNERIGNSADRIYNTVVLINDVGNIAGYYRKTHLYDALGHQESLTYRPGDCLFDPIDTPFGRLGLFVCYELRFPEVARRQRAMGADIIVMPAAWAAGKLKEMHLLTLVCARAIENGVYVAACNQCGMETTGGSVIVDPMGVPIASAGEDEGVILARVDTARVREVRAKLPSYEQRRPELYGPEV